MQEINKNATIIKETRNKNKKILLKGNFIKNIYVLLNRKIMIF